MSVCAQGRGQDSRPPWQQEQAHVEHTLESQRREMLMDEQWLEQEERQLVRHKRARTFAKLPDTEFTPDASASPRKKQQFCGLVLFHHYGGIRPSRKGSQATKNT